MAMSSHRQKKKWSALTCMNHTALPMHVIQTEKNLFCNLLYKMHWDAFVLRWGEMSESAEWAWRKKWEIVCA